MQFKRRKTENSGKTFRAARRVAQNVVLGVGAIIGLGAAASDGEGNLATMGPDSCSWGESDSGGYCEYSYTYDSSDGSSALSYACDDGDNGTSFYGFDIWNNLGVDEDDCF